jgi:hypothetical protein
MRFFRKLFHLIKGYVVQRLESTPEIYEQRDFNDMEKLYRNIRKGDVVLVEGRSKMSTIIKLFSHSHWSHVALYIGDELIKKGEASREKHRSEFGSDAGHLLVEAFVGPGVIASPIKKYQYYNLRLCRPYGISKQDLEAVVEDVISHLGKHYDEQNIIDLALMLLPVWINPFRKRGIKACLGQCSDFQVICSGMIAKAFQGVKYPIVPAVAPSTTGENTLTVNPYGKLVMRHYSQILPRDFDLSPNFEIIKFNIIEEGKFDYKSLWQDNGEMEKEEAGN